MPRESFRPQTAANRSAEAPGIGHNSGERPDALEQRRRQFIEAITTYVDRERTLTAEQFTALKPFCRLLALRKALLQAIVELSRANSRADTTALVLVIIMFFADNRLGLCTISVERMAEMLGRSQGTVTKAVQTLEANGLVKAYREPGRGIAIRPTVDTVHVGDEPIAWFLEAYAPRDSCPKLRGRWREPDRQHDNSPLTDMGAVEDDSPQSDAGALADSPLATPTTAPALRWGNNTTVNNTKREEPSLSPGVDHKSTGGSAGLVPELNGFPWVERIKKLRGGVGNDDAIIAALNNSHRALARSEGAAEGRMKLVLDELDAKSARGRATDDPLQVLVSFGKMKSPAAADAAAKQVHAKATPKQSEIEYLAEMKGMGIPDDIARANWREMCRGRR